MSEKTYNAAEYYRLSYTDDKENESDSINNQRIQIKSYLKNHPDIISVSEWVDDGVSGVFFDRPAFKQMMKEIECGKIDCIIVKDLSRFGREYIETGRYLRRILPAYGVRFIALNDNIDTAKDNDDDLIISVKTIINDAYCRDISTKTRSALSIKREKGDYVGACPIYGYKKDEENHNQLVIDEYPAEVVRQIFRMKIEGLSADKISTTLNNLSILSPLEYKKSRGLPHPKGGFADKTGAKWSAKTIFRILHDETYTGTLIQGKQSKVNYKMHDIVDKPESEWKRTENSHEPIIVSHDYDLAQRIMRLDTRAAPGNESVNLFSGLLICNSCGAQMTRKTVPYKNEKYYYYFCQTTKKNGCKKGVMLKEDMLHDFVFESIKAQISGVASIESMITGSNNSTNSIAQLFLTQINECEKQLDDIFTFKSTIYENMVIGLINTDEYKMLKAGYTNDETKLRKAIDILQEKYDDVIEGNTNRIRWIELYKNFDGLTELNRQIVISLVKSIRIFSKNEMTITFNYQDEFAEVMPLIQHNKEVA